MTELATFLIGEDFKDFSEFDELMFLVVVFNEMKGLFADSQQLFVRTLLS